MCGRFQLSFMPDAEGIFEGLFDIPFPSFPDPPILAADILPFREITAIHMSSIGDVVGRNMLWNLIPRDTPAFESKRTWFNTRKETLNKPLQKTLLQRNRCIVPVNRFFENRKIEGRPVYHSGVISGRRVRRKESYAFTLKSSPIMALGALFDVWNQDGAGRRYSCSIITQPPNSLIGRVHDRMPFILTKEQVHPWLDPSLDQADALLKLIKPIEPDRLEMTKIWPEEPSQGELF